MCGYGELQKASPDFSDGVVCPDQDDIIFEDFARLRLKGRETEA